MNHRGHSVLWIALGVALSPSLVDLAEQVAQSPWARGAALFPPLLAYCAWTDRSIPRPSRDGLVLLALGVVMCFLGVGGGMPRVGRPGIALAVIGLARFTGRPPFAIALLALWAIPLPTQVSDAFSRALEAGVASAAARVATAFGFGAQLDASHAVSLRFATDRGFLELFPSDGGLPLAWSLAGIGWFAAIQRSVDVRAALRNALLWSLAALPLQAIGLAVACVLTLRGSPRSGRLVLDSLPVAATFLALCWAIARRSRSARPAPQGGAPRVAGAGA